MIRPSPLQLARLALIGVSVAALGVSGCGRKGPLDPPPLAAAPPPSAAGQQANINPLASGTASASPRAFDSKGHPIAPPGEKKQLPIDWLLN